MKTTSNPQPHLKKILRRTTPLAGMSSDHRVAERYAWLRWVAVLGQLSAVLMVYYVLSVRINIVPIFCTIGLTAITNLIFHLLTVFSLREEYADEHRQLRDWPWELIIGLMMVLDLLVLTTLLYNSGGLSNPFAVFYLVNICLAGVTLSSRLNGIIINIAIFCCVFLCFFNYPVSELLLGLSIEEHRQHPSFRLLQYGMLIAITTCALVIGYFTTLVSSTLRRRDAELREAENQRARSDKLEALGTLAAGAAHELSTPLATIAIVSKELDRSWQKVQGDPLILQDIKAIRSEVDRCRAILNRMSAKAGLETVEATTEFTVTKIEQEIMQGISDKQRVQWNHKHPDHETMMRGPLILLSQALRGLIHNALEASENSSTVMCETKVNSSRNHNRFLELSINDQGEGMSPEILERVGEPFFTTKPTGKGMGLGLFLCRSVVERLGGTLRMESARNQGTSVIVELPLAKGN
jgi:two-component system sensor histidine kinase RegB